MTNIFLSSTLVRDGRRNLGNMIKKTILNIIFIYYNYLIMNPTQSAGWLNIDQMLQNLQQVPASSLQTEQPVPQVVEQQPQTESEMSTMPAPSFSVDTLTNPVPQPTTPAPVVSSVSSIKKKFVMPAGMRIAVSSFATLLVLIIGGWVMSIQYPEESQALLNGVTGTFSTLAGVTNNNIKPDGIVVVEDDESEVHGVAQEDPYLLDSPLADAMDDALGQIPDDNKAEQLFGDVFSGSDDMNTIDFSTNTSTGETPSISDTSDMIPASTYNPNFNLPSTTALPTVSEFQTQLLSLSEKAESAMTNFIGNNDVSLAKMRVVYKNIQSMTEELAINTTVTDEKVEQYNQLLSLYNGVVQ